MKTPSRPSPATMKPWSIELIRPTSPCRPASPRRRPSITSKASRSHVLAERVEYLDENGKLVTESLRDYSRKAIRKHYASLDAIPAPLEAAERKEAIIEELAEEGLLLDPLAGRSRQRPRSLRPDLPHRLRPAAAHPPRTGRQRAQSAMCSPNTARKPAPCLKPCSQKYQDEGVSPAWMTAQF